MPDFNNIIAGLKILASYSIISSKNSWDQYDAICDGGDPPEKILRHDLRSLDTLGWIYVDGNWAHKSKE